ncbi:MAG: DNA gyrase inhibitor YacG [Alphaproteobacteria bacterium]|nr:DNA gyrase inhibitor YacG [Alphaproteobacteria bacterium]
MAPRPGQRQGCPICGAPPTERLAPFCSTACADRDLAQWVTGRYAIASAIPESSESDGMASSNGDQNS